MSAKRRNRRREDRQMLALAVFVVVLCLAQSVLYAIEFWG